MPIRLLLSSAVLLAAAASAAGQKATPSEAARSFTLDGLAPSPVPSASASPTAAPILASPAVPATSTVSGGDPAATPPVSDSPPATPATAAVPPALHASFTLDTPIEDLIADPGAKAVLDKDLPGMSDDENLPKFKAMSLHQLQPQTGGQLTDALLMKVASDLNVLAGGNGQVTMPKPLPKPGNSKRNRDESR